MNRWEVWRGAFWVVMFRSVRAQWARRTQRALWAWGRWRPTAGAPSVREFGGGEESSGILKQLKVDGRLGQRQEEMDYAQMRTDATWHNGRSSEALRGKHTCHLGRVGSRLGGGGGVSSLGFAKRGFSLSTSPSSSSSSSDEGSGEVGGDWAGE